MMRVGLGMRQSLLPSLMKFKITRIFTERHFILVKNVECV